MSTKSKEIFKTYRFPIVLIISIILGSIIGLIFGEKAIILKPFGGCVFKPNVYYCSTISVCNNY